MTETLIKVWGGYCYFPDHPLADMHGIVRFCIRAKALQVRGALARYGVNLFSLHSHYWSESKSHVEAEAAARNHGEVFFCSPTKAYLSPQEYVCDFRLTTAHRRQTEELARTEGRQVASAGRRSPRSEFP